MEENIQKNLSKNNKIELKELYHLHKKRKQLFPFKQCTI